MYRNLASTAVFFQQPLATGNLSRTANIMNMTHCLFAGSSILLIKNCEKCSKSLY